MTVLLEKDWISMICVEGLRGESLFSLNKAARFKFTKPHLNKSKDFWNNVIWMMIAVAQVVEQVAY